MSRRRTCSGCLCLALDGSAVWNLPAAVARRIDCSRGAGSLPRFVRSVHGRGRSQRTVIILIQLGDDDLVAAALSADEPVSIYRAWADQEGHGSAHATMQSATWRRKLISADRGAVGISTRYLSELFASQGMTTDGVGCSTPFESAGRAWSILGPGIITEIDFRSALGTYRFQSSFKEAFGACPRKVMRRPIEVSSYDEPALPNNLCRRTLRCSRARIRQVLLVAGQRES